MKVKRLFRNKSKCYVRRTRMTRAVYNGKPLWVSLLEGLGISTILLAKTIKDPEVDGDIDDGNQGAKKILYLSCEAIRIDDSK